MESHFLVCKEREWANQVCQVSELSRWRNRSTHTGRVLNMRTLRPVVVEQRTGKSGTPPQNVERKDANDTERHRHHRRPEAVVCRFSSCGETLPDGLSALSPRWTDSRDQTGEEFLELCEIVSSSTAYRCYTQQALANAGGPRQ